MRKISRFSKRCAHRKKNKTFKKRRKFGGGPPKSIAEESDVPQAPASQEEEPQSIAEESDVPQASASQEKEPWKINLFRKKLVEYNHLIENNGIDEKLFSIVGKSIDGSLFKIDSFRSERCAIFIIDWPEHEKSKFVSKFGAHTWQRDEIWKYCEIRNPNSKSYDLLWRPYRRVRSSQFFYELVFVGFMPRYSTKKDLIINFSI